MNMKFCKVTIEDFLALKQKKITRNWEIAVLSIYLCLNCLLESVVIPILPNNKTRRKLQTDRHYQQIATVISSICPQALFLSLTNANLYLLPVCQTGRKKMESKRCMETVLVQFGVLPTGNKIITSATRNAQGNNHLFVFFFFLLYRLSCLALWIGMTQTTLEAITICPLFCKIHFCLHSSKLFKAKGTLASCTGEELRYRHTLHLEGSFSTFFSGTKSRILQRKISL